MIETVTKLLYFLAVILAALVPAKHALHMFQQNRYELGRYVSWIEENLEGGARRALIPTLVIVAVAFSCMKLSTEAVLIVCILIAAALAIVLFRREQQQQYIKPLVYTDRVKRQIAVLAILYAMIQIILLVRYRRLNTWLMLAMSYFGPWLLIFPMALITSPIENAVKKWYINDAKKKLAEHDTMIRIGITGSYGKTSTKNAMQAVLLEQFCSLMTPASYNTPMGITRTIREYLKPIDQIFICEMGADHVGDITELMNFVHPTIGVVTSIGPQHLATFGSQENIIHEKMQMIEMLPEDGFGVLNYDCDFIRNYCIHNSVKTVSYGIDNQDADYRAENIRYSENGTSFTLVHGEERVPFETKLLGKLNILNILSAIAVSRYLQVSWPVIQKGVKSMKQVEHRLEQKIINGRHFIDDAFNSNPSGSHMALEVLSGMPSKRWIVTPGMIDLGPKQNEYNHAFGAQMKDCADRVILVGETQTKPIYEGLKESGFDMDQVLVMHTVKEAFAYLWQNAAAEDTILLENDLPDAFNH